MEIEKKGQHKLKKPLKLWLYGVPMSGKTFLARQFPDPVHLNNDNNYDPEKDDVIHIADKEYKEGRQTKIIYGCDLCAEAVDYLLSDESDYKTVIVDLIEDVYASIVRKLVDERGVSHIGDIGFAKGYDIAKNEFFELCKKLTTQNKFNVIFCSHEIQKLVTKIEGNKAIQITVYDNPLKDTIYNKVLGMTNLVGHVYQTRDGRKIGFKKDDTTFGGARGKQELNVSEIDANYDDLVKLIIENHIDNIGLQEYYDKNIKNKNVSRH